MRLCRAKDCNSILKPQFLFCGYHWEMVPLSLKGKLADAYETPRWKKALFDTIATIQLVQAQRESPDLGD